MKSVCSTRVICSFSFLYSNLFGHSYHDLPFKWRTGYDSHTFCGNLAVTLRNAKEISHVHFNRSEVLPVKEIYGGRSTWWQYWLAGKRSMKTVGLSWSISLTREFELWIPFYIHVKKKWPVLSILSDHWTKEKSSTKHSASVIIV